MNDIEKLKMLETYKGKSIACDKMQGNLIQLSADYIKRLKLKTVHNPSSNANRNYPTTLPIMEEKDRQY
ncbi:hypothetical protein DPMN_104165 [Dreissena polymorpha]|uniref:Uncharacterized protein n=1 Tax=Dreissena polymorpha TaxID=45954 RepID=A0A9D4HCJ9_DREPO|nr:hypothetical protein DPMN_104165 [Dreissena polymorpha]